jgi:hypothetical protein
MSYVNKAQALVSNMRETLVSESNTLGSEIIERYKEKGFACTFIVQLEIIKQQPKFAEDLREIFGKVVSALGGTSFYFTEANSARYQEEQQIVLDLIEDHLAQNTVIDPNYMRNLDPFTSEGNRDKQYMSAEQFQSNQRIGRPSVIIFISSDIVTALRVVRRGTGTLRGLSNVMYPLGDSPTGTLPTIGGDLNTDYSLNIFLKSLMAALHSDTKK